ncbi:MAG: CHAT domain-containing protein [Planctomycetes bacterium]|nr:CHAT domain-containing protein [Planctomycetota bacterium]
MGPEQRGEGVVSLARGFLVAGSQRVVATQWLVADEATARLVGQFCQLAAAAESADGDGEVDYAKSLWEARRWLRRQPGYESPFYWAPFVLIGPP